MKFLKDIYFYDAKKLALELKEGTVSEYRGVKHFVAFAIIAGISLDIPLSATFEQSSSNLMWLFGFFVFYILGGVISYYGIWLCYQINNKGDGKDFFLRFSILSLPIGIQLTILFFGIGLIVLLFAIPLTKMFGIYGVYLSEVATYLLMLVMTSMFYFRMKNYIAIASKVDK